MVLTGCSGVETYFQGPTHWNCKMELQSPSSHQDPRNRGIINHEYLIKVPGSHPDQMTQGGNWVLRLGVCMLGWGWKRFTVLSAQESMRTVNLIGMQNA